MTAEPEDSRHAICETHRDGEKLISPLAWCGEKVEVFEWSFQDAQHLLRAVASGTGIQPCHDCLKVIKKVVEHELGDGPVDSFPLPSQVKHP